MKLINTYFRTFIFLSKDFLFMSLKILKLKSIK